LHAIPFIFIAGSDRWGKPISENDDFFALDFYSRDVEAGFRRALNRLGDVCLFEGVLPLDIVSTTPAARR
jgi:hypothetical protein